MLRSKYVIIERWFDWKKKKVDVNHVRPTSCWRTLDLIVVSEPKKRNTIIILYAVFGETNDR